MLKITECGLDYEIDYGSDNVRNAMLRHIEHLEQQLAAEREACAVIANSYGSTETEMAIRSRSTTWMNTHAPLAGSRFQP